MTEGIQIIYEQKYSYINVVSHRMIVIARLSTLFGIDAILDTQMLCRAHK